MDDRLWGTSEVDPDEHRSLAKMEQRFLLTGDSGESKDSDMQDRIDSKAKKLPDRIQQLIDDISLLYYHGYVDDVEDDIWDHLLSISKRSQTVRRSPIVRTAHQQSGPELDLGFELGSLIRFLHDQPVPAELVWGIIIGLVGESDSNWEREAENLGELFEELEDFYEARLVSAGTQAHEDDSFQEERNTIREILREYGFATAPPLVEAVLQEHTTGETAVQLDRGENLLSTDSNPPEYPEPPSVSPSLEDVQRTSLESIVSRLANQTQLRSIDRLAKDLKHDVLHIQNREIWSVDLDEIFCFLGENGETNIQDFDQVKSSQSGRTHALKLLSYKDSTVVNRPVTKAKSGADWELTPYGEILYKTRIEYNCSTNWIYNVIADPERLDDEIRSMIFRVIRD